MGSSDLKGEVLLTSKDNGTCHDRRLIDIKPKVPRRENGTRKKVERELACKTRRILVWPYDLEDPRDKPLVTDATSGVMQLPGLRSSWWWSWQ
ncbi:hypothetical protein M0804_007820 [Polistes exclamans]|nr:hypothetical protein M0804_007820 [Polistes exclamans]